MRDDVVKNVCTCAWGVVDEVENLAAGTDPSNEKRRATWLLKQIGIDAACVMEVVDAIKLAKIIESNCVDAETRTRQSLDGLAESSFNPQPTRWSHWEPGSSPKQ